MLKNNLLFLSCICVLISCKKKDDEIKLEVPFYEQSRTIIYSDDFVDGQQSIFLDKNIYSDIKIGTAYVQTGIYYLGKEKMNGENDQVGSSCGTINPGYLNIGCPRPVIIPEGYEKERSYELGFADTLFAYSEVIELNMNPSISGNIAFQIDYQISGYTEFQLGIFKLKSAYQDGAFNNKTVNISIDPTNGTFVAFSDGININDQFFMMEEKQPENRIKFVASRWVKMRNGVPYVNSNGIRIDKVEVYKFN